LSALWTAHRIAAATGGRAIGDWRAEGVSIDTRSLRPGDLFVALTDRRDGHDFVAEALSKGAAGALVSRHPQGVGRDAPLVFVDDVLAGLGALGRDARARTGARVVAVTGSVGKTSTKDMLGLLLSGQGRVHAAEGSFNNHWGVPLTLARLPADADFAIVEIGMNHPGEIAPLARLARPHVGLITTVAAAHLHAFDGLRAIAGEKAALFAGLEPGGTAVINGDLEVSAVLEAAAAATGVGARITRFGRGEGLEYRLERLRLRAGATVVEARRGADAFLFKLATAGAHFAMNALGALAVVDALGADFATALGDLGRWTPPAGRGTLETVVLDAVEPDRRVTLIDDAYNANPASLAAALDLLAASPATAAGGRRVAILGDMLELGEDARAMHREMARHPALARVDVVHCVGPLMRAFHQALPEARRGTWHETAETLAARAHSLVDAGDTILVKGSKGSRISLAVDAIRKLGRSLGQDGQQDGRGT